MSQKNLPKIPPLNKPQVAISKETREARYDTCKSCKFFMKINSVCKLCGCDMEQKTHVQEATCPAGKW
jgi:hypothetical protein